MPKNESDHFRERHLAAYKAILVKAAEKLGLSLTEENLPAIAREARSTKPSRTDSRSCRVSPSATVVGPEKAKGMGKQSKLKK